MKNDITVYVTNSCPFCTLLKNFLNEQQIPFKEVNVENDPVAMREVVSKTGQMGVPQTEINGKWVIGFDPDTMMSVLN